MRTATPRLLIVALILGASSPAPAAEPTATVRGQVVFDGVPPPPAVVELRPDMQQIVGRKTWDVQPWKVGTGKGLADCVVTLVAADPARREAPKPVTGALLEKVGAEFTPHVLVVTPGSTVTYRNKSPVCRCFGVRGRWHQLNQQVADGNSLDVRFNRPDVCQVYADLRPFMRAWIQIVDTPYFAVTDAEGRFQIKGIPSGRYNVRVWHEELGRFPKGAGPQEATVEAGVDARLSYKVTAKKDKPAPK